jgi:hypothetical protein
VHEIAERHSEPTLEQRIDMLLERVRAAREEIVDRGLDAVRVDREHRALAGHVA